MAYKLTWLADTLLNAGLKVAEVPGWQNRGRAEMGDVLGILCHHTAGPKNGNMPSLRTLIEGRSDLQGPLSQLGLGRDGTYYVIAAGRCNHAGSGSWQGLTEGNSNFIGIEAENTGLRTDPWPDVQMDAYRRGAAAILKHVGRPATMCAGHKEYALPPGRKTDPPFDMTMFRSEVSAILAGTVAQPPPIPAVTPAAQVGGTEKPTLRRNATGEFVALLQQKLQTDVDGYFGPYTEAAVRALQKSRALVPDGIVGPKTWALLDPG